MCDLYRHTGHFTADVHFRAIFQSPNCINEILSGRPKGGLAILFKSSLAGYVTKLDTHSRRVCALRLHKNDTDIIIINVYVPCDNRLCANYVNPEYRDVIYAIEIMIEGFSESDFIISADWNTDVDRINAQTMCFNEFMDRNRLLLCWNHLNSRKDYTYLNYALCHSSCVDHFIMSAGLYDCINECSVNTTPLNRSDHCVVKLVLRYDMQITSRNHNVQYNLGKVMWHKVTDLDITMYRQDLDNRLEKYELSDEILKCNDVGCNLKPHRREIDTFCSALIGACLEAGNCLPKCQPPSQCKPEWNASVNTLRNDSLFWHILWVDNGRPPTGVITSVMPDDSGVLGQNRVLLRHRYGLPNSEGQFLFV